MSAAVEELTLFGLDLYNGVTPDMVRRDGLAVYGACTKVDPETMFPEEDTPAAVEASIAVCRRCPLAAFEVCRDKHSGEEYGTWAAKDEYTRRREVKARDMAAYRRRRREREDAA